jgi:hypothetical protein
LTALNDKLRAWWSHRQALDGRLAGKSPAEVLSETGWARSVGGVGPYLTLFARAGTSREAADAAVEKLEIHELPSARRCTYVLPAADFALGLKAGEAFDGEMKLAVKLGVTEKEVDKLCDAVLKALSKGALDPEEIRQATGSASRSLGDAGKKKGLTTTLPLALGQLQSSGDIRRVPVNGRLDQQRYKYSAWKPNPMAKFKLSPEEVQVDLARRYFHWTGPATAGEFRWFSALNAKAAQAAMKPLKLIALDDSRWILPEQRDAFESFRVPKQADYRLVAGIDGISLLRRDLSTIADAPDLKRMGSEPDVRSHAIFDRGRLVGLWEYDPETESIAWASFIGKNKEMERAVARTEEYVRTQLGDARSFSLDSPKSRAPRIQALRAAK